MENVTEEFLELYRRLEGAIRVKYGDEVGESPVWWMAHKARGYRGVREELDYCREVRNVLQHRQRLEGDFAVVPSKGMVAALRRIVEKVERLRAQMAMLKAMEAEVEASPDGQISLTDPDARAMATSGRGSGIVGYNVQSAVEGEHHLIVAHEVVMTGSDKNQLAKMVGQGHHRPDKPGSGRHSAGLQFRHR